MCKVTAIDELVEQIKKSKRIAKASVIQERMLSVIVIWFPSLPSLTQMQSPRRPVIQMLWLRLK